MELGEITVADIFLTIVGIVLGGAVWIFFKRVTNNKNVLNGNKAGGDIAGGNILKTGREKSAHSTNRNTLNNNVTKGDIAGGDIEK